MKNDEFLRHLQQNCNKKLIQGLTIEDLNILLKSIAEVVTEQINNGETVKLLNIGQFHRVKREPRSWKNPRTGETEFLEEKYSINFRVSDVLKSKIREEEVK